MGYPYRPTSADIQEGRSRLGHSMPPSVSGPLLKSSASRRAAAMPAGLSGGGTSIQRPVSGSFSVYSFS